MKKWIENSIFYHIYPLGFCGAPEKNSLRGKPENRIIKIKDWIPHLKKTGFNAIYLGPVFESETHGYDTVNYYEVDRRLGTNNALKAVCNDLHENGIKIVLDGVFNHVGRSFPAFQDVQKHQSHSRFKDWFEGINFSEKSPLNDPFSYKGWNDHYHLVKLNLKNEEVRDHIFNAIRKWIHEFDIDGLRLDAADVMDLDFLSDLARYTKSLKSNFWLMGEVIHGDYSIWANMDRLDSTTNYECYKGLYSSHNDSNYFEIAHSLNRLFGEEGLYKNLHLYNFADNHDVNRVADTLYDEKKLYPLYGLLFTMPGIPSVYYGSEWGIYGKKQNGRDEPLRPDISLSSIEHHAPHPDLVNTINQLINCRKSCKALIYGDYNQLDVTHEQLIFQRKHYDEKVVITINMSDEWVRIPPDKVDFKGGYDLLNNEKINPVNQELYVPPCWLRIIKTGI